MPVGSCFCEGDPEDIPDDERTDDTPADDMKLTRIWDEYSRPYPAEIYTAR
jgi:hypothetical protein